jgi:hypothetical protein
MTLKTRWFGKKVKGEPLKSLVSALGENPKRLLESSIHPNATISVHGRVGFIPTKEGVNVDLYVFREESYKREFSDVIKINFITGPSSDERKDFYYDHIQGEIKYNKTH